LAQAAQSAGEEQDILVPFLDTQGPFGVTALAAERRVFEDIIELDFIPFVFAAADGVTSDNGRVIETVEYGVHGCHADNVFVALETVERAALQKLHLRGFQPVAQPAFDRKAVGAWYFPDKLGAGVGKENVFVGGDEEAAGATSGIANGFANFRVHHFYNDADQMARRSELGGLLLATEIVDENLKQITFHIGIFAEEMDGRDDVHSLSQGRPVRDDNSRIDKQSLRGG